MLKKSPHFYTYPLCDTIIIDTLKSNISLSKCLDEGVVVCLFGGCEPSSVGWKAGEAVVYNIVCVLEVSIIMSIS